MHKLARFQLLVGALTIGLGIAQAQPLDAEDYAADEAADAAYADIVPDLRAPRPGVINPRNTFNIRLSQIVGGLDRLGSTIQMRLNNHKTQSSFVSIAGRRLEFQIPRTVIDIDCGTFCPDLGDALFYLNDINLRRTDFSWNGGLVMSLVFEDNGREIKGYHNKLGDNFVPDFNMRGVKVDLRAQFLAQNGELVAKFTDAKLTADIHSTGGCSVGGIDLCNKLFGTSRKIQRAAEGAALGALNSPLVQLGLRTALRQVLQTLGVTGQIASVRVVGSDLRIITR